MEDKDKGVSRRSFLKTIGAGIAGVVGYKVFEKFSNLEKKPTFHEINEGESIPLKLPGSEELTSTKINYREKDERLLGKLQAREIDGKVVWPLAFEPGASRIRKVGEILDIKLYKLKKNSELPEDTKVHYYPNAEPPVSGLLSKDFSEKGEIYGLSVIVAPRDYMQDGKNPTEINGNTYYGGGLGGSDNNLTNFGIGWALCLVWSDRKEVEVFGFVGDNRALVEDK